jgi:hypothetical protein
MAMAILLRLYNLPLLSRLSSVNFRVDREGKEEARFAALTLTRARGTARPRFRDTVVSRFRGRAAYVYSKSDSTQTNSVAYATITKLCD